MINDHTRKKLNDKTLEKKILTDLKNSMKSVKIAKGNFLPLFPKSVVCDYIDRLEINNEIEINYPPEEIVSWYVPMGYSSFL